jgi:hypothetical protein
VRGGSTPARTQKFSDPNDWEKIQEKDRLSLPEFSRLAPRAILQAMLMHADGTQDSIRLKHSLSDEQIEWFKAGSALNYNCRRRHLLTDSVAPAGRVLH